MKTTLYLTFIALFYSVFGSPNAEAAMGYRLGTKSNSTCPECVYSTIEQACQSALALSNLSFPYHYKHYIAASNRCVYWWDPYRDGRQVDTSLAYGQVADDCPPGKQRINNLCVKVDSDKNNGGDSCSLVGNPINAGFANKYQEEADFALTGVHGLTQVRYYNSLARLPRSILMQRWGWNWRGTYDRAIDIVSTQMVIVYRPNGTEVTFNYDSVSGLWKTSADTTSRLEAIATGWRYTAMNDDVELYNNAGRLESLTYRGGITLSFTYSDGSSGANGGYYRNADGSISITVLPAGLLLRVADGFGRTLRYDYGQYNNVVRVTTPDNAFYRYSYDPVTNNLLSVTYPDGKVRTYKYNESNYNGGISQPYALTGIVDENNQRYTYYQYDATGQAISTFKYVGGYVDKFTIAYTTDTSGNITSSTVTDPLNTARTYSFLRF